MIDPISAQATMLRFKLDPGEPGVVRRAKASDATTLVTAQERRNLPRLSTQARLRGEEVISANISYKRAIIDGRAAVVGGRTTVTSREVPDSGPTSAPGSAAPGSVRVPERSPGMLELVRNALLTANEHGDMAEMSESGRHAAGISETSLQAIHGLEESYSAEGLVGVGQSVPAISVEPPAPGEDDVHVLGARVDVRI
jgi:hypothetical protein